MTAQFFRFATLNPHQLAGHVANLDFWADEITHCLRVIDQYNSRFDCLAAAQGSYVSAHNTIEFSSVDPCCTERPAARPKRIPDRERQNTRRELCDVFYRFIVRCCNAGLIDEAAVFAQCKRHDISVDPHDLKHRGT